MKIFSNAMLVLCSILVLGFALRIYRLGSESLWLDEGGSLLLARWKLSALLNAPREPQPPLFMIMLHYWIMVFGNSEISARMISALCGSASVYLLYRCGMQLFDKSVGLLAALFLALSPLHVYFSQEARLYSLYVLLTLASMFYFHEIQYNTKAISIIGYIFTSLLLLYSQSLAAIIIFVQNVYVFSLFASRNNAPRLSPGRWLALQLALLALYLPGIFYILKHFRLLQRGFWIGPPSFSTLGMTVVDYSGWSPVWILFAILIGLGSLSAFLVRRERAPGEFPAFAVFQMNRGGNYARGTYLCGLWLLGPLLIPFMASLISTPIFITRITLGALPAFYILSARGVTALKQRHLKAGIVICICALCSLALRDYYRFPHKERWREAAAFVDAQARKGDLAIFHVGFYLTAVFDYYSRNPGLNKTTFPPQGADITEGSIDQLGEMVNNRRRVWLILCQSNDCRGLIKRRLSAAYELRQREIYPYYNLLARRVMDIEVCLFEMKTNG